MHTYTNLCTLSQVVQLLLENGANPHSIDSDCKKPVELANKNELRRRLILAMDAHTNCMIASVTTCTYSSSCINMTVAYVHVHAYTLACPVSRMHTSLPCIAHAH